MTPVHRKNLTHFLCVCIFLLLTGVTITLLLMAGCGSGSESAGAPSYQPTGGLPLSASTDLKGYDSPRNPGLFIIQTGTQTAGTGFLI
jgi:hypothetical protein